MFNFQKRYVQLHKLRKEYVAIVVFGAWDAVGASGLGYPAVWVNRLGSPAENPGAGVIASGRNNTALIDFVKR